MYVHALIMGGLELEYTALVYKNNQPANQWILIGEVLVIIMA